MMQSEFESKLGAAVTREEYAMIQYVYTWHPACSATNGKQEMADLYRIGGMGLIRDMTPRATRFEQAANESQAARRALEDAHERQAKLERDYLEGR